MTPLHRRLRARQAEIEGAILTRVLALAESDGIDFEYTQGLRGAIAAAVDYGLGALELGEERSPGYPPALLAQARLAARSGVSLDSVTRRYFAGHSLLTDFVVEEAEREGSLGSSELQRLLRAQASAFDRLLVAVSEEHTRECEAHHLSSEERTARRIERLLTGGLPDNSQLSYDFEGYHLGVISRGPGAPQAIRELADALDRHLLSIRRRDGSVWAWLGGRRPFEPEEARRLASATWPPTMPLAIGEPARGLSGWRLTAGQANAAWPIALRSPGTLTRYADVALLALAMGDELLATSLRQIFLAPLERERDGGEVARETLRAYFEAGLNASSAAALLGVSPQAVTNRLKAIEAILHRPLTACAAELETALSMENSEAS